MKISDSINGIKGRIEFKIINANTGELISEFTEHNIITDVGYRAAAQALAGVTNSHINRIIIGQNTVPPAASDTSIGGTTLTLHFTNVEYPDNFSIRFNFMINANTGNGMNMAEFGLLTADGRLFSRLVRPQIIEKTDQIEVLGGYIINL
jgi:hypothetical protein